MVYICTKFHENILDSIKLKSGNDFHSKISKGYNSVKDVGRVTILFFCTLSDGSLYFYKVL